ncbi:GON-4-like protein isoform X2 [Rhinatrema bivittatum]|uniref:GON-4-like protein isoform X2 n=1 Tax=Rhinatrema bivittatum TaxID=194408 RepID=UPI001128FA7B|nr:GON-4-like protein isoform X2 [Rhinatrema bivittatum]
MLPCKKRKPAEPPSPQPRVKRKEEAPTFHRGELKPDTAAFGLERSRIPQPLPHAEDDQLKPTGWGSQQKTEDGHLLAQDSGDRGSSVLKPCTSLKPCSQLTSKLAAESSLRSEKGITRRFAPAVSESHQHAEELEPTARCPEEDKGAEAEKPPKMLQGKGERTLKQATCVFASQSPKPAPLAGSELRDLKESKGSDKSLPDDEETDDPGLFITVEEQELPVGEKKRRTRKFAGKQKRNSSTGEREASLIGDLELDDVLDRTLEDGAKQHKLTAVNVRNILHEVITNEHVVAMMKAAINETENMPVFEPKMTRSKLKEVVEKGVVIPTWNISPIKKANEIKPPQFVDIPLEEEDSSDEEYQPEEDEEDETAEESLLESDVESISSPNSTKGLKTRASELVETDEEGGMPPEVKLSAPLLRHISAEVVPMGPPPPPTKARQSKDSMFMAKLHAVDEELAFSPVCMDSFQPLDASLIAFRTRSKRPLKNVPLGQLEAELRAPDITPDMYDLSTADDEDWKKWLQGLMTDDAGNEDEADDDDDPEYNFLEDLDEPDTEDFRNDRAVRITKKEVNELMEELFETFQDEMGFSNLEDDGQEDEDSSPESHSNFNTPQAIRFEEPLANILNEQHRTVRQQLELLRLKKSVKQQQQTTTVESEESKPQNEKATQILILDLGQKRRLQQQMQQHVQLLTQIHMLSSSNPSLGSEADTARMFLRELATFASNSTLLHRQFIPEFQTIFETCNLKESLQLIEDFHAQVPVDWSPPKAEKRSANDFPCLPKHVAWLMATRSLFMYPELLPICSLKAKNPRDKVFFTKAEDNLLALGLKHFEGSEFPKPLISKYLLTAKTAHQLTVRIKNLNMKKAPENIIRYYKKTKLLPILFKCCEDVQPHEARPPVEREEQRLPFWLKASLTAIQEEMRRWQDPEGDDGPSTDGRSGASSGAGVREAVKENTRAEKGGASGKYPLIMPKGLVLTLKPLATRFSRRAWRQKRSSVLKPLLMKPAPSVQSGQCPTNVHKSAAKPVTSEAPPSRVELRLPQVMQPVPGLQSLSNSSAVGSFSASVSQTLVYSNPATFQPKMMLPMLASTRVRKPCIRRGYKKKMTKMSPILKTTPLTHPAPVIFTVPAGAVKLVSLGSSCSVIQPVNMVGNKTTQGIPITAVLVNPTTFPCQLNQPLVTSPLFVSSTPLTVPVLAPEVVTDPQLVNVESACTIIRDENSKHPLEPKVGDPNLDSLSPIGQIKEQCSPDPSHSRKGEVSEDDAGVGVAVKTEKVEYQVYVGGALLCPAVEKQVEPAEPLKVESKASEIPEKQSPTRREMQEQGCLLHDSKEELVLGLEQELDVVTPQEDVSKQGVEIKSDNTAAKDPVDIEMPASEEKQSEDPAGTEGNRESTSSAGIDIGVGSPAGKPEDNSSADGHSVGTPTDPETGREKEGQDEEEEEDFDDLTQDEEDEEMSSASEESVLSVPELQETMEKLTWLASERRLSQEGDSEEENSQEENSEPEEEEEEEAEGVENLQKDEEMVDEAAEDLAKKISSACASPKAVPEVESSSTAQGDRSKGACKGRSSHRARSKRGRTRASKDTSKLLLLYDENILLRDPLRDQKDLAFAQAYLTRVREALQDVPGKYEEFLRVIFEFETSSQPQTAVELYSSLRGLLQDWPQLLRDFAAFLLPEQALECGLFEEQQAFDKSRRFLRQLEICFAENPSHHQKIIRVLQSCADCLPQEITELKTQMWQLLKGHDHLQDEFSMFFDQLRPPASRMGDFEVINWTEEKEYEFDGFEEVSLPDMEEEEEPPKMHPSSRNKRRKEVGSNQMHDKACDNKSAKGRDSQETQSGSLQAEGSPQKEVGTGRVTAEECQDEKDRANVDLLQEKRKSGLRKTLGSQSEDKSFAAQKCPNMKRMLPDEDSVRVTQSRCSVTAGEAPSCTGPAQDSSPSTHQVPTAASYSGLNPPAPQPPNMDSLTPGNSGKECGYKRTECAQKPPAIAKALSRLDSDFTKSQTICAVQELPHLPVLSESSHVHMLVPLCPPTAKLSQTTATPACSTHMEEPPPVELVSHLSPAMENGTEPCSPEQLAEQSREKCAKQQKGTEATVCAKNSMVSSTGEKVVLWTREADRVILTTCQERGAQQETFHGISQQLGTKTPSEVSRRFRELMRLFHTSCDGSSEEEEEDMSTSNTEQLSDRDVQCSEEDE